MKKSNDIEPVLVSYLLEKEGISLPMPLMRHEAIIEIEKALRTGRLLYLHEVFRRFSENIEQYFLKENAINEFINQVKQFKSEHFSLSQDDEKIIDYLAKLDRFKGEFLLETIGPLYFLLRTFEEMEKIDLLPKTIQIFIIVNSYVILYELILHEIDRRLNLNLKSKEYKNKKWYNHFFKKVKRKEYGDHATAGIINEILSDILSLPKDNNSIFGGKSETRIFRNKVAHANVFYDENREEIIIIGSRYKLDEFLKLFFRLFSFLIRWLEKSLMLEMEDFTSFENRIISDLRNSFNELSKTFLKFERAGELRIGFMNLVISWKKEAGLP